ncbi:hypothetical protein [Streptomyces sp. NPDC048392]|uniref:hypothetical protein n=1 Tax=Streptomyces sp. NPDC048392 TaxID=3365543 RepID=UPI003716D782
MTTCSGCRGIADAWWRHGIADEKSQLGLREFEFYEHIKDEHPAFTLMSLDGCRTCAEAVTMAQFVLPGMATYRKNGDYVDPAELHFVRHALEQTAESSGKDIGWVR